MEPSRGFLALPSSGGGPGVLVLHAWWGLNETIKEHCLRLARAGFVAYAPDLYRGKLAHDIAEAEVLGRALDADAERAKADIAQASAFLCERMERAAPALSVIGFSLGAHYALELANTHPDRIAKVVLFYGTGTTECENSRADYLGHFAEQDLYEPKPGVDALEAALQRAGRAVTFHHYAGVGHWFAEPDRAAYAVAATDLAWARTLAFLGHPHASTETT